MAHEWRLAAWLVDAGFIVALFAGAFLSVRRPRTSENKLALTLVAVGGLGGIMTLQEVLEPGLLRPSYGFLSIILLYGAAVFAGLRAFGKSDRPSRH